MATLTSNGREFEIQMPELTGSAKQITWAVAIRRKAVLGLLEQITGSPARLQMLDADPAKTAALIGALSAEVGSRADARYWIDTQGTEIKAGMAKRLGR